MLVGRVLLGSDNDDEENSGSRGNDDASECSMDSLTESELAVGILACCRFRSHLCSWIF